MSESRSHKATSSRITLKYRNEYNNGKGVDIKSSRATVEVETPENVGDAPGQLRGHRVPAYIAVGQTEKLSRKLSKLPREQRLV